MAKSCNQTARSYLLKRLNLFAAKNFNSVLEFVSFCAEDSPVCDISKRIYLSAMNMECNTKLGYITPYNYWKRPLRTNGNNMLTSLRFKDKLI